MFRKGRQKVTKTVSAETRNGGLLVTIFHYKSKVAFTILYKHRYRKNRKRSNGQRWCRGKRSRQRTKVAQDLKAHRLPARMVAYAPVAPLYIPFEVQPSVHVVVCLTVLCMLAKASSRYRRHTRRLQSTDDRSPATVGSGGGPGLWLAAAIIVYYILYMIGGCTERRREKRQCKKRNLKD